MLRTLSLSLLISVWALLVLGVSTSSGPPQEENPTSPSSPPPPPGGDPTSTWALRLYQALHSSGSKSTPLNTFFSLLLLATSLGAMDGGAGGSTAKQLRTCSRPQNHPRTRGHC